MNKSVTLVGNFAHAGTGIGTTNYSLLKGLIQTNIDLKIFNSDSFTEILPKIPLRRKLAYALFLHIRDKNIHFLDPDVFKHVKNAKVITTFQDLYVFDNRKQDSNNSILRYQRRKKFNEAFKLSTKIIAISSKTKEDLLERYGESFSDKIVTVNGVIDDKFFLTKLHCRTKNSKKIVIGYINNFSWNKIEKLRFFIETFKKIKDNTLEFNIYGKNFPFSNLISDDYRIKYLGFLPEEKIVQTIQSFDVYLSTSIIEGIGLPILQAKALGVPVLCYNGELDNKVINNTIIWEDSTLLGILKHRSWEKSRVITKAKKDAEAFKLNNVLPKLIRVYSDTFDW